MKKIKRENHLRSKQGFTMVEVTLALAFISMLLISIATITTSISALYRKGITLKTINSVGRNLVSEVTSAINNAPLIDSTNLCNGLMANGTARQECKADNAYRFIYQSLENNPAVDAEEDVLNPGVANKVQYGGVFCTGSYSYIWNTFYGRENDLANAITFIYTDQDGNDQELKNFKLLRVKDNTYRACTVNIDRNLYAVSPYEDKLTKNKTIDMRVLLNGVPRRINNSEIQCNFLNSSVSEFEDGDENSVLTNCTADSGDSVNNVSNSDTLLDLYEFVIFHPAQDVVTLRGFFAGTFILATDRGDVNVVRSGEYCNISNYQGDTASSIFDLGSEFNYCGINKFNFAARTAGSGI